MNQPATASTSTIPPNKYLDLARKIKEIEMENAKLAVKLEKSNQHLFRLRLERSILMEKLRSIEPKLNGERKEEEIRREILQEMEAATSEEN